MRQRRYALLMGSRVLCVLAAVLAYQVSLLLALGFMVGGAVLPWCAVLIANDNLPKVRRPTASAELPGTTPRALNGVPDDRIIDL